MDTNTPIIKETEQENNIIQSPKKFRKTDKRRSDKPEMSWINQVKEIKLIRKDPFGNFLFLKRMLVGVLGAATYPRFNILNTTKVEGAEYLMDLPNKNVMFISNHQTYFADVMVMYHIFCSVKWKFKNINFPIYLLNPRTKMFYVAAEETMKDGGWLPRLLSYTGAVTIKRSWRAKGEEVQRGADTSAPNKIKQALAEGWVVTFPQGTTKAFAPVRKGSAHLIHELKPIVVPVYINGFRRAFDKKGFFLKKRGTNLQVTFKKPVQFTDEHTIEDIQKFIEKHVKLPEEMQTVK